MLVQLCAPREAIRHFHKVKTEKETLKLRLLLSQFPSSGPDAGSVSRLQQLMSFVGSAGEGGVLGAEENLLADASEYAAKSPMILLGAKQF